MTPPALVLVNPGRYATTSSSLAPLNAALSALRPDLLIDTAQATGVSLADAVARLVAAGAAEVVCVPLRAAAMSADGRLGDAVAHARTVSEDAPVSLADPLGATGPCFAALDRQLQRALAATGARELDALVLWHDATETDNLDVLERRARVWSQHHRLGVRLAPMSHPHAIDDAVRAHRAAGHRHIGVATLAIAAEAAELARAARLPGVVGVARPLGSDPAVTDAVLASYSVAALRSLDLAA